MGQVLLAVIGLFLVWDAVWWFLGVKPRFPWQLKARLDTGAADVVLLDVRTPLEYNWFHLPGAQNIPQALTDSSKIPPVSPAQEVVIICMTGHRSPLVAYRLKKRVMPGSTISPGECWDGRCMSGFLGCGGTENRPNLGKSVGLPLSLHPHDRYRPPHARH